MVSPFGYAVQQFSQRGGIPHGAAFVRLHGGQGHVPGHAVKGPQGAAQAGAGVGHCDRLGLAVPAGVRVQYAQQGPLALADYGPQGGQQGAGSLPGASSRCTEASTPQAFSQGAHFGGRVVPALLVFGHFHGKGAGGIGGQAFVQAGLRVSSFHPGQHPGGGFLGSGCHASPFPAQAPRSSTEARPRSTRPFCTRA